MKILYVCSSRFDYSQDLLYAGLVKILGSHAVTDYPWNVKFHLPVKNYPKNLGYTSPSVPLPHFNRFDKYDIVVLAATKPDALQRYQRILPYIKNKPAILIDGGDMPETGGDFYRLGAGQLYETIIKQKPFDIIFKREYLPNLHNGDTCIVPFPFSFPYNVNIATIPEASKKYEVVFWGQQQPAIREKAIKLLTNKYDCAKNGTVLNQHLHNYKRKGFYYLQELAASKIVLNFRGGGWDTMRYWEAPATGAFMISQQLPITIPYNFEAGRHIANCSDTLNDLIDKIDYYLQRPEERQQMAAAAKKHLQQYHLNTVRAQTFIDEIKQRGLV
jgi:hypothetical protein